MLKKSALFLSIVSTFALGIAFGQYDINIDTIEKKVYLSSGDMNISTENMYQYFSGSVSSGDISTGALLTGEVNSGSVTTGTTATGNENSSITPIFGSNVLLSLTTGSELDQAIYWMYNNGLTMYSNDTDYRSGDYVTREEAAKLMAQLYDVLGFEKVDKKIFTCGFTDTHLFNPTLSGFIIKSCERGIFGGSATEPIFIPHDNLTKGQVLTVLMRILEGKKSDESANPWWIEYYVKAKNLGITNESNLANIDLPSSRGEVALLIYRFKNLIVGQEGENNLEKIVDQLTTSTTQYQQLVDQLLAQLNALSGADSSNNTSGSNAMGTGGLDLDIIVGNTSLSDDPEFNEAIKWMYDQEITSYNTVASYLPFETITREQVAKMIDYFASATNLTTIRNTGGCSFSDVSTNSEFRDPITRVCQYGVMGVSATKFNPTQTVTKAEFMAMLIRLFDGKSLDENTSPRWMNYYNRAIELSLISAPDTVTFKDPISRYEVAIFLYRMKVRLTMYNNLNESQLSSEILKTLEVTSQSGDTKASAKVYIDILSLNNSAFTNGYIELLGTRYLVKKSTLTTYNVGSNSFVRYGDLYDLETDSKVGTVTFILTNGTLTEGSLRLSTSNSYLISKSSDTTTHYLLKQI